MPVRFRCAYCNQLLGIARRKAGSIVRCPTCSGQVVVPSVESVPAQQPAPVGQQPAVFEQSDFEEVVGAATEGAGPSPLEASPQVPMPVAPAGAWGTHAEPAFDVAKLDPSGSQRALRPGIVLSPTKATVLAVLIILALGLAFGAGVLVGKFVLGS